MPVSGPGKNRSIECTTLKFEAARYSATLAPLKNPTSQITRACAASARYCSRCVCTIEPTLRALAVSFSIPSAR